MIKIQHYKCWIYIKVFGFRSPIFLSSFMSQFIQQFICLNSVFLRRRMITFELLIFLYICIKNQLISHFLMESQQYLLVSKHYYILVKVLKIHRVLEHKMTHPTICKNQYSTIVQWIKESRQFIEHYDFCTLINLTYLTYFHNYIKIKTIFLL